MIPLVTPAEHKSINLSGLLTYMLLSYRCGYSIVNIYITRYLIKSYDEHAHILSFRGYRIICI